MDSTSDSNAAPSALRCYDAVHPTEQRTLDAQPELGMNDVSLCLPGWIESFCKKFDEGEGWLLSHSQVNAIAHTLIAARKRQHRLIAERDAMKSELVARKIVSGFDELAARVRDGELD